MSGGVEHYADDLAAELESGMLEDFNTILQDDSARQVSRTLPLFPVNEYTRTCFHAGHVFSRMQACFRAHVHAQVTRTHADTCARDHAHAYRQQRTRVQATLDVMTDLVTSLRMVLEKETVLFLKGFLQALLWREGQGS